MEKQRDSSVDLFYAYRCMSMDVITSLSFGNSVDAVHAPDHRAPIILAMDASLPVFVRFKHAAWYRAMIMNCPPRLSRIISPETAGLVDLQQLLKAQIASVTQDPDALRALPHNTTIYHQLLDSANYRDGRVPEPGSLYEESQALMFGGADTTGNTLMHGSFHILSDPAVYHALRQELLTAWPDVAHHPTWQELEQLPYLVHVPCSFRLPLLTRTDGRHQRIHAHQPRRRVAPSPRRPRGRCNPRRPPHPRRRNSPLFPPHLLPLLTHMSPRPLSASAPTSSTRTPLSSPTPAPSVPSAGWTRLPRPVSRNGSSTFRAARAAVWA